MNLNAYIATLEGHLQDAEAGLDYITDPQTKETLTALTNALRAIEDILDITVLS